MLKIVPKIRWIQEQNFETDPVITLGIRKNESIPRRNRHEWEFSCEVYDELIWNPLVDWNVKQVFSIHKKYGVEVNPMYKKGFKRVGCFPCVNCGRNELILMDKHYPERIAEIDRWEKELDSTYLAPRKKGVICKICAYYDECRDGDSDCENGEYFYPKNLNKVKVTTEVTRNAGRRFSKKPNQSRKSTTVDQFLDDLEYERRFF